MKRSSLLVVTTLCAFGLLVCSAPGNIAIPPEPRTEIRMVSEAVKIDLGPSQVAVDVTFDLRNAGGKITAAVGFPRGILEESLEDFRVTVDGAPVETRTQRVREIPMYFGPPKKEDKDKPVQKRYQFEGPYPDWQVFDVAFDAGQTRTVRVRYYVRPAEIETVHRGTLLAFIYTLRTGATWKGNIEKATVEVTLNGIDPSDLATVTPAKYERSGSVLTWTFEDFKPTQDIELTFRRPPAVAKGATRSRGTSANAGER